MKHPLSYPWPALLSQFQHRQKAEGWAEWDTQHVHAQSWNGHWAEWYFPAQDCLEANESRQLLGEGNQLGFQQSCAWMGHWGRAGMCSSCCSPVLRNGSEKTNSSVVLNWEGKQKTNRWFAWHFARSKQKSWDLLKGLAEWTRDGKENDSRVSSPSTEVAKDTPSPWSMQAEPL